MVGVAFLCAVLVVTPRAANVFGVSILRISDRFSSLTQGASLFEDQSLRIRLAESHVANEAFSHSSAFGEGPGHTYSFTSPVSGVTKIFSFTLDTPLLYPAKFGVVGVAILLVLIVSFIRVLRKLNRLPSVATAALIGFAMIGLCRTLVLSPALEDKGFTLGFLLLLTMSLSTLKSTQTPPSTGKDSAHAAEPHVSDASEASVGR